jgi:hypothetical protein
MPAIPNYSQLAVDQANLSGQNANQVNLANRANQNTPNGTLTWTQDPNTGQWTQNQTTEWRQQNLNNEIQDNEYLRENQANALLRSGAAGGINTQGLQDWGSTDILKGVSEMPDGSFGASQQVIDAVKGLQQPGLDQNRDAERARLAAMGITMGSDASNSSERNLSNASSDADLKAILAGTQEYGNVFNRQLAQRQQGIDENVKGSNMATALRGSQLNERIGVQSSNMATINGLTGGVSRVDPKFSTYSTAASGGAPNLYGAAQDEFNAMMSLENAGNAASANRTNGAIRLATGVLGSRAATGALGSAWNAASDWWGADNTADTDALGDYGSSEGWW